MALVGWTIARTALIIPGLLLAGVDARRAVIGGVVASSIISGFTYFRIKTAGQQALGPG